MLILYNANIYTHSAGFNKATAMCIDGQKIVAVGSDHEILDQFRSQSECIDLRRKTIWPGLCDAHLHLQYLSESLQAIDCETETKAECLKRVRERSKQISGSEWIKGHGWNQNVWENAEYGNTTELDAVADGKPVFLTSKSLHAAWANSTALRLAGITRSISNPDGGIIMRDPDGEPNGILLESATRLVSEIIPPTTDEQLMRQLKETQAHLWRMGITAVHDFDGFRVYKALEQLNLNGDLKLSVLKNLPVDMLSELDGLKLRTGMGDNRLKLGHLKMFADGALGPLTAAMFEPYEGRENSGILLLSEDEIIETGLVAAEKGWGLTIHAIGDLANHTVLTAYTKLHQFLKDRGLNNFRNRVEHVQCIRPEDQALFKMTGATASVQPLHATSDMDIADRNWGNRSKNAYVFADLQNLGILTLFGSDAPVESCNPFWGLHAAVNRRRKDGTPGEAGWHSEQRISLGKAVDAYTVNPAVQAGWARNIGRISPGFYADLIALEEDPFVLNPHEIADLKPAWTMVDGKFVFGG